MTYLIVQTFVLLLAAALLGALLAWYLTRMVAANDRAGLLARLRAAEREAAAQRARVTEAERDAELLLGRLAAAEQAVAECEGRLAPNGLTAESVPAGLAPDVADEQSLAGAARPPVAVEGESTDDLQQIRGIGPKIAAILSELGIRRFEQIAAWTPEHIDWVNAQLRFKGRVEREDWITQARALLAARAGA